MMEGFFSTCTSVLFLPAQLLWLTVRFYSSTLYRTVWHLILQHVYNAVEIECIRHIPSIYHIFPHVFDMRWTTQTQTCSHTRELRPPAAQLLRRWEYDHLLKHSSPSSPAFSTLVFPSFFFFFRNAGELSAGRPLSRSLSVSLSLHLSLSLSLSLLSVVESAVPPWGPPVWTFRIRICNDTQQSKDDAAITEWRTSDRGEEGPDQTRPSGSNDESQGETVKAWLRCKTPFVSQAPPSLWPQSIICIQAG